LAVTKGHVVLILSLGTLVLSRAVVADSLEVRLSSARPVFSSSAEVKLWATLVNSGPGCAPLFVDPVFSTSPSPVRPQSLLTLTIHDKFGRRFTPRSLTEADATTLRLHELLLLACPRGVYRFSSFEEADAWMNTMLVDPCRQPADPHPPQGHPRPQDAIDRAFLEGVLRERGERLT
jgi:hypothetical protein